MGAHKKFQIKSKGQCQYLKCNTMVKHLKKYKMRNCLQSVQQIRHRKVKKKYMRQNSIAKKNIQSRSNKKKTQQDKWIKLWL